MFTEDIIEHFFEAMGVPPSTSSNEGRRRRLYAALKIIEPEITAAVAERCAALIEAEAPVYADVLIRERVVYPAVGLKYRHSPLPAFPSDSTPSLRTEARRSHHRSPNAPAPEVP